jgi:hypothetical protein
MSRHRSYLGLKPQMRWTRIDGGSDKFATWQLDGTNYRVEHCGHPTAHQPWVAKLAPTTTSEGYQVPSTVDPGAAFRFLDDAKVHCERDLRERTTVRPWGELDDEEKAAEARAARACVERRVA